MMRGRAVLVVVALAQVAAAFVVHPTSRVIRLLSCSSTHTGAPIRRSSSSRLYEEKEKPSSLQDNDDSSSQDTVVGIGGADGVVYDVNRLKRNLVQETVREYKRELWELLSTPTSTQDEVESKLAALVQANPVSTTTDSNLLDGQWAYAFGSSSSCKVLLDPDRFLIRNRKKHEPSRKPKYVQHPFQSATRQFRLEDSQKDPSMVDQIKYLGGLVTKKRKYTVMGLTRTNLRLDMAERQVRFCGRALWKNRYPRSSRKGLEICILYLDPDLCVASTSVDSSGPFAVYTKNTEWMKGLARMKRKVRHSLVALKKGGSKQISKILLPDPLKNTTAVTNNIMLERVEDNGVTVIKLGDLEEESHAWEGESDPFVHLTADERQNHLRTLSVRQIERAKQLKEKRKRGKRPVFQRIKQFKKPQEK